ncbi:acetoacetyl-CoA reductase [Rhodosalinus sp.]|uniref:acetoacetyl-CoA reductase n=1 Tax=Rhodosalinus sp. TaxID=2047741 RepID=UPI0035696C7A
MSESGRIALVTGGVQGLGAAAARALQDAGYTVAATHYRDGAAAERFTEETGIPTHEWDVADYDACTAGVEGIETALGPVDVLVNNAGVNRDMMFHKMTREAWDQVMSVDLGSMFNMCQQVIGGMRERGYGRIVNISSVNAARGQAGQTNYCAAKAGIEGFTRALARETARKGITVNAIAPGYADTPMVESVPDKIMDRIVDQVPKHRLAEPDEIGRAVLFLAAEEADFVTGTTLNVSGGFRMG